MRQRRRVSSFKFSIIHRVAAENYATDALYKLKLISKVSFSLENNLHLPKLNELN